MAASSDSDILVRRVFLSGLVTIYCGHCMPSSLLSRATETDALIVCMNEVVLAKQSHVTAVDSAGRII